MSSQLRCNRCRIYFLRKLAFISALCHMRSISAFQLPMSPFEEFRIRACCMKVIGGFNHHRISTLHSSTSDDQQIAARTDDVSTSMYEDVSISKQTDDGAMQNETITDDNVDDAQQNSDRSNATTVGATVKSANILFLISPREKAGLLPEFGLFPWSLWMKKVSNMFRIYIIVMRMKTV